MGSVARGAAVLAALLAVLGAAWALAGDGGPSAEADLQGLQGKRSPAEDEELPTYDDDQGGAFSLGNLISGRVGRFFTDLIQASSQLPATVFRLVSGLVASQPLAKLREEVRNLNISYPK